MLVDAGLHLHLVSSRLADLERLSPGEVELRKRLYNSAYIWDKTLSLALGRPPSLTRRPHSPSDICRFTPTHVHPCSLNCAVDYFDDAREWKPVYAPEVGEQYVPVPSYNTTTFCAHSQLHEVR